MGRPEEFCALARKEGWSDKDALKIASRRIDVLEAAIREKDDYQTKLIADIREAERRVEMAEYREKHSQEMICELREKLYGPARPQATDPARQKEKAA